MLKFMRIFFRSEKGTTAIEYGLIVALMTLVIVVGIQGLGTAVSNTLYNKIAAAF